MSSHLLLVAGRYGPALHEGAIGATSLFGPGSLVHADTVKDDFSFVDYMTSSYAQPVFTPQGVSDLEFRVKAVAEVHEAQMKGLSDYLLDTARTSVLSAAECFHASSQAAGLSVLVCGWFYTRLSEGRPQWGETVLFVVNARMVTLLGSTALAADVFPDVSALGPSNFQLPEYPLSILGASVASATRNFTFTEKASRTYGESLEDMIFCFDGLSASQAIWITSKAPPDPLSMPFFKPTVAEFCGLATGSWAGPGDAPLQMLEGQSVVLLPVMFPLEFGHNIPVGQLWLVTIGSRDFRASLKEMQRMHRN